MKNEEGGGEDGEGKEPKEEKGRHLSAQSGGE
jgi:hypothetical protein